MSEYEYGQGGQVEYAGSGYDDDGYDEYREPADEMSQIYEALRDDMQQQLAPIVERQLDEDLGQLEEDYPQLQENGPATALLEEARDAAQELGRPDLATDPRFLRQVWEEAFDGGEGYEDPDETVFHQLWRERNNNQLQLNWDRG